MQRCSASVASLASALAKAQAELTNPEKSLLAKLPAERGQPERSFRYAPLSGGLDIVRKTLGRNEIATIQTTDIDHQSSTIKLTTTLAHASGEWVASEWPVCSLAELPTPHRMGAALTYARRYALFTLVGIAGDDDIDAPDLPLRVDADPPAAPSGPTAPRRAEPEVYHRAHRAKPMPPTIATLEPEASKHQRDRLLAGIGVLASLGDAAAWAKQTLPVKNTLLREHAQDVETAFESTFARIAASVATAHVNVTAPQAADAGSGSSLDDATPSPNPPTETVVGFGYPRRHRDKAHLKFVASHPCLICNRRPCDAHHLRFAPTRALGRKVSDEFTVPLCRTHHRQVHQTGKERDWWAATKANLDPMKVAEELWQQTRGITSPVAETSTE